MDISKLIHLKIYEKPDTDYFSRLSETIISHIEAENKNNDEHKLSSEDLHAGSPEGVTA